MARPLSALLTPMAPSQTLKLRLRPQNRRLDLRGPGGGLRR